MSDGFAQAVGWASSLILVLTIAKQVYKQYKEGSSQNVSKWLFVGQLAASTGFLVYSFHPPNPVFIATNALMVCNALLGFGIVIYHRRRERREGAVTKEGAAASAANKLKTERA